MVNAIIKSIKETAKDVNEHTNYPTCPGIYAFMLKENSCLGDFGNPNQVIYVGIAKDSLKKRDLCNHFNSRSTGSSTLRRSIGAILKKDFNLTAFSRNGTSAKRDITNYKFNEEGETELTNWMKQNLLLGYWEDTKGIAYKDLRNLEENVILELKPSLDLDPRTKKYNVLANKLDTLRAICRTEAESVFK